MTLQDAYMESFCKTAAAYGVDPAYLAKFAQQGAPQEFKDTIDEIMKRKNPTGKPGYTYNYNRQEILNQAGARRYKAVRDFLDKNRVK